MTKRKWLINVLIDFAFIILFFIIYQISILRNLDVFGATETGGGIVPYGARVQGKIFLWAIVSIIIVFIIWRIKKLNIKLIPLFFLQLIFLLITDFYIDKVVPENVECLDAVTIGEKEVTLITCTTDSKYRIIVKAKEIEAK